MRKGAAVAVLFVLGAAGCKAPEPKSTLEVSALEGYWAIDRTSGDTKYLAPVVRFQLKNTGRDTLHSVQANVRFERTGSDAQSWGSSFGQIADARQPLKPGEARTAVLTSDGHYTAPTSVDEMFKHEQFRDARAEVYLRVSSSPWVSFGRVDVERALGARSVRAEAAAAPVPAAPAAAPSKPPGKP